MLVGARGTYELAGEIASGGTATVHLARLTGPGGGVRVVAIKRLHEHLSKDAEFRSMLADEARLAARIHHPNVCSVLDVITEDATLALVLDYVTGASLAELARRTKAPVPVPVAVAIACGVLAGLGAAHAATDEDGTPLDIVHRDVSPQNILVGLDGIARLTDFGTAKALGRVTETGDGIIKGKVAYMSPEQVRGEPLDKRTDLYSAGVILWEMLTGRKLFAGTGPATMLEVLEQVVAPPSALGAGSSPALDALVMRAIARDPKERFATAREMAIALELASPPALQRAVAEWIAPLAGERTVAARAPSRPGFAPPVTASPSLSPDQTETRTRLRKSDAPPADPVAPRRAGGPHKHPSSSTIRLASTVVAPDRTQGVAFDPSLVETAYLDRHGAALVYGPLLAQVRRGDLTLEALQMMASVARFGLVRRTGPIGLIGILEAGATIPSSEVRDKQREIFRELLSSPKAPAVAYVVLGRDIGSTLLKSVVRFYFRGNGKVHCASDVEDAIRWLAPRLERPPQHIRAFVAHAREVARVSATEP